MMVSLTTLFATAAGRGHARSDTDFQQAWQIYRRRFVRAEGRVVDTGNGGVSHTEGQGWGMLFAEAADDRQTFDELWTWSRANLMRPEDGLLSWRWLPNRADPVPDRNNATDGDLFAAWALSRAARRWQEEAYRQAALRISQTLLDRLVIRGDNGKVRALLPGLDGFRSDGGVTLNLSYYVFPALFELVELEQGAAQRDRAADWQALILQGLLLVRRARFGRSQLPPDWLRLSDDDSVSPDPGFPPRFGYDAVRVPLYLAWSGLLDADLAAPFQTLWSQSIPGWVDLSNDQVSDYQERNGYRSVASLVLPANRPPLDLPADGLPTAEDNYYSASLTLLALLATIIGKAQTNPAGFP